MGNSTVAGAIATPAELVHHGRERLPGANNGLVALVRLAAVMRHGLDHSAPLQPDRLLWVNPHDITQIPRAKPSAHPLFGPFLVDGDWDRRRRAIAADPVYEAFVGRFMDGLPWPETGYVEYLASGQTEHDGRSFEVIRERCRALDALFRSIKSNGYRTQASLAGNDAFVEELRASPLPPNFREVTVDIARDGSLLWNGGMHRLIIAQLLDLPRIPVRVNVRHPLWQGIRNAAARGVRDHSWRTHPDVAWVR